TCAARTRSLPGRSTTPVGESIPGEAEEQPGAGDDAAREHPGGDRRLDRHGEAAAPEQVVAAAGGEAEAASPRALHLGAAPALLLDERGQPGAAAQPEGVLDLELRAHRQGAERVVHGVGLGAGLELDEVAAALQLDQPEEPLAGAGPDAEVEVAADPLHVLDLAAATDEDRRAEAEPEQEALALGRRFAVGIGGRRAGEVRELERQGQRRRGEVAAGHLSTRVAGGPCSSCSVAGSVAGWAGGGLVAV